jgi:hypothetical protein
MSEDPTYEEVDYRDDWEDESTQCKNCKNFQEKDQKTACVPEDMTFEAALEEYGEAAPTGHCSYFQPKKSS